MIRKPLSVWMVAALIIGQQTLTLSFAQRNDRAPRLPHAGSVYVDARHNTRLLRVTDEGDARAAEVVASTTFNADATRFLVTLDDVPMLYRFDSASLSFLK